jgi:hypothetical protein
LIRITVAQTAVRELTGNAKTTGKPYHLRFQNAYAHTVDQDGNAPPFPEKFEISLGKDQAAYPIGDYQLAPASVYIDRDGRLACQPKLLPLKPKAA